MDDLEQQLRAWAEAQGDTVAPVSPHEAIGHATGKDAAIPRALHADRRRPRRILGAVAVAAAIIAVVTVAVTRGEPDQPLRTTPAATTGTSDTGVTGDDGDDGWVRFTEPSMRWTLDHPDAWTTQSWHGLCMVGDEGTLITNQAEPLARPSTAPNGCTTGWEPDQLRRTGFVGIQISHFSGGPYQPRRLDDTPLPLAFDALPIDRDDPTGEQRGQQVVIGGDGKYSVTVWIGPDAPNADVATARRLVASIRWPSGTVLVPTTGGVETGSYQACMVDRGYHPRRKIAATALERTANAATIVWGPKDEEHPKFQVDRNACARFGQATASSFAGEFRAWPLTTGASQRRADAARDHVLPEVAALPMAERAPAPSAWFRTEDGHSWAITLAKRPKDGTDCVVGDPSAPYGTGQISLCEYAEVLEVDADGSIVHAYPMPSSTPTWLLATRDAIYAGRVGDGGEPESTLVRIDRTSYQAQVLVFPTSEGGLQVGYPNWSAAPDGAAIGDLVHVGVDQVKPTDTLVDSWIGVTGIDLAAVEALFQ